MLALNKQEYSIGLHLVDPSEMDFLKDNVTQPYQAGIPVFALETDVFVPKQASNSILLLKQRVSKAHLLKTVICASPLLYAAYCTRQHIKQVILSYYHKNIRGEEQEYYRIILKNVQLISAASCQEENYPAETKKYAMCFERIDWEYVESVLS